ncbi:hypothetical protein EDB85DRAFT_2109931 [Lactarius pseudohatsudake]|nr:hypothetical protein EDB85DRAFT_2109931 [Lactarius pseudohatsudake]
MLTIQLQLVLVCLQVKGGVVVASSPHVLQCAAPTHCLSDSTVTSLRPRRPPLQTFVSRGSVHDRLRLPVITETSRAPCSPLFPFPTSPHLRAALATRGQRLADQGSHLCEVSHGAEAYTPVVLSLRSVTSTVALWFYENETAQVLRSMKALDPGFSMEGCERELREYIVPEVVDVYLSADNEALKVWCPEAIRSHRRFITYNVLWATMEQYLRQGMQPDLKALDIRQVDVSTGRFLEDNTPVFVITFTAQEVLLFCDRKTREVVVGAEDRVEQCNYAAVVTCVEEDLENELTGGWKVIEWLAGRGACMYGNLACSDF